MSFYPNLQTRSIRVDDLDVTVYEAGTPRPDTPTVVLVHGTGGTLESHFSSLFSMLAGRQHVVGLDLATPAHAVDLDDLVAQVVAVLRATARTVVLVGYSLGAVVAAAVAGRHPDLVARLVLISGWLRTDDQQRLRNDVWRTLFEEGSPAFGAFSTLMFFGAPYLAHLGTQQVDEVVAGVRPGPGISAQMELNRRIDITSEVAAITAPTLVIGGIYDQMVPIAHSRRLFGAIADARLAELPTGHASVIERPAELFAIIDDFASAPTAPTAGTIRVPAVI